MAKPSTPRLSEAFAKRRSFDNLPALCPHCGVATAFREIINQSEGFHFPAAQHKGANLRAGTCRACRQLVVGVVGTQGPPGKPVQVGELIWPLETWPDNAPPELAAEIRAVYDDARNVLPLSAMASAVLARRCLQHVIRLELGITKKTLFAEIKDAAKRQELSQPTREAIDHVRSIGNWGAHPILSPQGDEESADEATADARLVVDEAWTVIDVSAEEAHYTLDVLEMVFHDIYTARAIAQKWQKGIDAKEKGQPESPAEDPGGQVPGLP